MFSVTYTNQIITIRKDLIFAWVILTEEGWRPLMSLDLTTKKLVQKELYTSIFPDTLREYMEELLKEKKSTELPTPAPQPVLKAEEPAKKPEPVLYAPFIGAQEYLNNASLADSYLVKRVDDLIKLKLAVKTYEHVDPNGYVIVIHCIYDLIVLQPIGGGQITVNCPRQCVRSKNAISINCVYAYILARYW